MLQSSLTSIHNKILQFMTFYSLWHYKKLNHLCTQAIWKQSHTSNMCFVRIHEWKNRSHVIQFRPLPINFLLFLVSEQFMWSKSRLSVLHNRDSLQCSNPVCRSLNFIHKTTTYIIDLSVPDKELMKSIIFIWKKQKDGGAAKAL